MMIMMGLVPDLMLLARYRAIAFHLRGFRNALLFLHSLMCEGGDRDAFHSERRFKAGREGGGRKDGSCTTMG